MSRRQEQKKDEGPGFLSSLLLAGGAAAVGFMAHKLVTDFQSQGQYEERQRAAAPSASAWSPDSNQAGKRMQNRTKEAKNADEDVPECVRCVVCLSNPREMVIIPCGHVCLCENCAEKITTNCPICKHRIESKKVVYI